MRTVEEIQKDVEAHPHQYGTAALVHEIESLTERLSKVEQQQKTPEPASTPTN